jgi:hypothetical protein
MLLIIALWQLYGNFMGDPGDDGDDGDHVSFSSLSVLLFCQYHSYGKVDVPPMSCMGGKRVPGAARRRLTRGGFDPKSWPGLVRMGQQLPYQSNVVLTSIK